MELTNANKIPVAQTGCQVSRDNTVIVESFKSVSWTPLLVILLAGFFYVATVRAGHEWGDDFSLYIIHAKNIASGQDYRQGGYLHYSPYLGPDAYPPIFPLLLAPVYLFFGLNLTALKMVVIAGFLASLLVFLLIVKSELTVAWQAVLLAAVSFNPYIWDQKDRLTSDLVFLVFAYLAIVLVNNVYRPKADAMNWKRALIISSVFYLSYGTRSLGLLLVPCLLLYDMIRRKKLIPSRFAIGISGTTLILIALQSHFLHSDRGYYDQFATSFHDSLSTWLKYIAHNVVAYVISLTDVWDNGYSRIFRLGLTVVITGLAGLGYLSRLWREITYTEIFVTLYVLVVLIVPMDGGLRYLIPAIPFYIFYAQQGLYALPINPASRNAAAAVLGAAILISYFAKYSQQDLKQLQNGISKVESVEFFDYIKQRTPASDVFIFTKPRALALFTERKSSFYPMDLDDKGLWDYFLKIHATHIVVGPKGISPEEQAFLRRFVDKYSASLQLEFSNDDFNAYHIMQIPNANGRTKYNRMRLTDPRPQGEPDSK